MEAPRHSRVQREDSATRWKNVVKSFRGLVEVKHISGGGRDNSRPHACINAATT